MTDPTPSSSSRRPSVQVDTKHTPDATSGNAAGKGTWVKGMPGSGLSRKVGDLTGKKLPHDLTGLRTQLLASASEAASAPLRGAKGIWAGVKRLLGGEADAMFAKRGAAMGVSRGITALHTLQARIGDLEAAAGTFRERLADNAKGQAAKGPLSIEPALIDQFCKTLNSAAHGMRDAGTFKMPRKADIDAPRPPADVLHPARVEAALEDMLRQPAIAQNAMDLRDTLDLVLLSDHSLTPGAMEFCHMLREGLNRATMKLLGIGVHAQLKLEKIATQLHLLLLEPPDDPKVLATQLIEYADARPKGQPWPESDKEIQSLLPNATGWIASLPEELRGRVRLACIQLIGQDKTKTLFENVYDLRFNKAGRSAAEALKTATSSEVPPQAAASLRALQQMAADATPNARKAAFATVCAGAAQSPFIQLQSKALTQALVADDGVKVGQALDNLKPWIDLLAGLPGANKAQLIQAIMKEPVSDLSLADLTRFRSALTPKPNQSPAPRSEIAEFNSAVGGVNRACDELCKRSFEVANARTLLLAEQKDPKALIAALEQFTPEKLQALSDPLASESRRSAVNTDFDALKDELRGASDALKQHMGAAADPGQLEALYQALTKLGVFVSSSGERKDQAQPSAKPASQIEVDAFLDGRQNRHAQQCEGELAKIESFRPLTAARALAAMHAAAKLEVASHQIQRILGCEVDAQASHTARLQAAGVTAVQNVPDALRDEAQDLLAVLVEVSEPKTGDPSPLAQRLDAIKAYLTGFGFQATQGMTPERREAAAKTLLDTCGIRVVNGVPFDANGMKTTVQTACDQMLATARETKPAAGVALSDQGKLDIARTTIRVEHRDGRTETLNEARALGDQAPANGAPDAQASPDDLARRLEGAIGADALHYGVPFMSQEVLGVLLGDYMKAHPDSPLRHQFGQDAALKVDNTKTEVTFVPGDGATTVKLKFIKEDCRLVEKGMDTAFDLDPAASRIAFEVAVTVAHDGSEVDIGELTLDMPLTERAQTADAAALLYIDSLRPIPPGTGSNAEPELRDGARERAQIRLSAAAQGQGDPRTFARAALVQAFNGIDAPQRMQRLKAAVELLPDGQGQAITDSIVLGVHDAIQQAYLEATVQASLDELGAAAQDDHEVNGVQTGVSGQFWVDFRRSRYEVQAGERRIVSDGRYGEATDASNHHALAKLTELAQAIGPTAAAGRQKLGHIGRYAHQDLFNSFMPATFTKASPLRLNGQPVTVLGEQSSRFVIAPQSNGVQRVTCSCRWERGREPLIAILNVTNEQVRLTDDSYAQLDIVFDVAADGSATLVGTPAVQQRLEAVADTRLGRIVQAARAFKLPSL